jgi:hypothetical protein
MMLNTLDKAIGWVLVVDHVYNYYNAKQYILLPQQFYFTQQLCQALQFYLAQQFCSGVFKKNESQKIFIGAKLNPVTRILTVARGYATWNPY